MTAMHAVGGDDRLSTHARVREEPRQYVVELDVADFAESELSVMTRGRRLSVRGDQHETLTDAVRPFRLQERLEESFLLPDDADADRIKVFYRQATLEIRVPRVRTESREVPIRHSAVVINPDAEPC